MLVNIINLTYRTDRHASAIEQMQSQGAKFNFWGGVQYEKVATGISRAHKQVVRWASSMDKPRVCVAEDDILFTHPHALKYFFKNEPKEDYDIYMASYYGGVPDENYVLPWFRGMTLYIVHERFYHTFLQLDETLDIDVALDGLGKYVVCPKFAAVQMAGYSDQRQAMCDDSCFTNDKVFFDGDEH